MINIDNRNILNIGSRCDCIGFTPTATWAYNSGAKTVTVTDATVFSSGDAFKSANVRVYDKFGSEAYAVIYSAAQIAAALTLKNSTAATTAAALTAKNTADDAAAGDPTNQALADAANAADAAYATALAASTAAAAAYAIVNANTASQTGAIDISALNPVKGLTIKMFVISNGGCQAEGIFTNFLLQASGSLAQWQKLLDAAQQEYPH